MQRACTHEEKQGPLAVSHPKFPIRHCAPNSEVGQTLFKLLEDLVNRTFDLEFPSALFAFWA